VSLTPKQRKAALAKLRGLCDSELARVVWMNTFGDQISKDIAAVCRFHCVNVAASSALSLDSDDAEVRTRAKGNIAAYSSDAERFAKIMEASK
jgi:hypothetical protein